MTFRLWRCFNLALSAGRELFRPLRNKFCVFSGLCFLGFSWLFCFFRIFMALLQFNKTFPTLLRCDKPAQSLVKAHCCSQLNFTKIKNSNWCQKELLFTTLWLFGLWRVFRKFSKTLQKFSNLWNAFPQSSVRVDQDHCSGLNTATITNGGGKFEQHLSPFKHRLWAKVYQSI